MRTEARGAWGRRAWRIALLLTAGCESIPQQANTGLTELPSYTLTPLGLLPGGTDSRAYQINNQGQVVGTATDSAGATRAVYFSGGAAVRLAELDSATASEARGINDDGTLVGSVTVGGVRRPVRWADSAAAPELLQTLGGLSGRPRAINHGGTILGQAGDASEALYLVYWTPDGVPHLLDPGEDTALTPAAINDDGLVAGNTDSSAFRWSQDDGFSDIGGLGQDEVDANGMNPNGVVVGGGTTDDGLRRAFRWTSARQTTRLGEPVAGDDGVEANAVNAAGIVAANSFTLDDTAKVTIQAAVTLATQEDRQFTALPGLGGPQASPGDDGINQCGVIVGYAQPASSSDRRAVAWVPPGCPVH
jgi:probable HAF family extracellular repeat protein